VNPYQAPEGQKYRRPQVDVKVAVLIFLGIVFFVWILPILFSLNWDFLF